MKVIKGAKIMLTFVKKYLGSVYISLQATTTK